VAATGLSHRTRIFAISGHLMAKILSEITLGVHWGCAYGGEIVAGLSQVGDPGHDLANGATTWPMARSLAMILTRCKRLPDLLVRKPRREPGGMVQRRVT
jgi:hypothetical protein